MGALVKSSRDNVYNSDTHILDAFRLQNGECAWTHHEPCVPHDLRMGRDDITTFLERRAPRRHEPLLIGSSRKRAFAPPGTRSGETPFRSAARITFLTFRAAHLQDSFAMEQHREAPRKTQPRLRTKKSESRKSPACQSRRRGSYPNLPGGARDFSRARDKRKTRRARSRFAMRVQSLVRPRALSRNRRTGNERH